MSEQLYRVAGTIKRVRGSCAPSDTSQVTNLS